MGLKPNLLIMIKKIRGEEKKLLGENILRT